MTDRGPWVQYREGVCILKTKTKKRTILGQIDVEVLWTHVKSTNNPNRMLGHSWENSTVMTWTNRDIISPNFESHSGCRETNITVYS